MSIKIPVPPNNELKDADPVEVQSSNEPWTELKLADGTVLKTKVVVSEVFRVRDTYTEDGDPLYVVRGQPITHTSSPESMKRRKH